MNLYEISKGIIPSGVYDLENFTQELTYSFNDNFSQAFYIGGQPFTSLRYDASAHELYATQEGGSEIKIWDSVDNFTNAAYKWFYYSYDYTVNAEWSYVVTTLGTHYEPATEDLLFKTNNGKTNLLTAIIGSRHNGVPAGVSTQLKFTIAQDGNRINVSYTLVGIWASTYQDSYEADYKVLGFTQTPGSLTVQYNLAQEYTISTSFD